MRFHFASDEAQNGIQLPNPRLLEVHFAIAEIFHASGMGEEIDKVLQDVEEAGLLQPNGTSDVGHVGHLLNTALWAKIVAA